MTIKEVLVASTIIILVLLLVSAIFDLAEGAAEPTPTAPRPLCSEGGRLWRGCFTPVPLLTPTPNEHWINPIPWPTYSYPTPEAYPAPLPSPTPEAYPEVYSAPVKEKKHFVAESGPTTLADSIWAWVLDLFTHEGD